MEERTVLKEKYKRPKKDKPKTVDTEHGNSKYGTTKDGETLSNEYTQDKLINKQTNNSSKESVVTDTPPLSQTFENLDFSTSEKPNNSENETSALKEKSKTEKTNSGGGGEKNVSIVSSGVDLDLDKDIAPKGLTPDKIDFIFLEAERITTPEIIAKFALWHERRATKTKGVRSCKHYQKIMSKIANSDLELHEIIQGLDMAYESTWTGLEIDWIKNRTRQKQNITNGTNNAKQSIKNTSPFFQGA